MTIKIQQGKTVQGLEEVGENLESATAESAETAATAATAQDPVTQIATDLIEGRITSAQAVDAVIEQTMSMELVSRAPESVRQEVESILRSAIETDAHLIALTQALD
ncbi:MAG: hypothetical protein JXR76_10540 [Deltaproteobacteria bacterium]|nr:hypothetical protein [Deltaproteobacteria bacterium]